MVVELAKPIVSSAPTVTTEETVMQDMIHDLDTNTSFLDDRGVEEIKKDDEEDPDLYNINSFSV
jgi:hypothetical protein